MPKVDQARDESVTSLDDANLKSTFFEQLVEHVFISELLQELYYGFGKAAEVLRSEVDASGYDVVIECNGYLRHLQLKATKQDATAGGQKVNVALAEKPSGCVVWIVRQEDQITRRMKLKYRYFGSLAGERLPNLMDLKVAKHVKGDAMGKKKERPNIRVVPKRLFGQDLTIQELVQRLFRLPAGSR